MDSEMIQALQTIADNVQTASQPGWVECLSIVISSISVVVSGIAIWFAIRVANKQNKIALFEKRFTCFQLIERFMKLRQCIQDIGDVEKSRMAVFLVMFDVVEIENINHVSIMGQVLEYKNVVYQMQFLFSDINSSDIEKLFDSFYEFFHAIVNGNNVSETYSTYLDCLDSFLKKYYGLICNNLTISNI